MLLAGVLNMDEAYASINWKTVFLMACLIPLGWAMDSSGAAAWVFSSMMSASSRRCGSASFRNAARISSGSGAACRQDPHDATPTRLGSRACDAVRSSK